MKQTSNNIKVIRPQDAAAGAKRKGDSFLQITKRAGSKPVKGTTFYQAPITGLTLDAQGKEERASGFFLIENVKIQACRNPATAGGAMANAKPTISARFSQLGADNEYFLRALQDAWIKRVNENLVKPDPDSKDGEMLMDTLDGTRKIHDIGQWKYSNKTQVKGKDGKLLKGALMVDDNGKEDPIMRWKLAFGKTFHEKCPYGPLRGKSKCVIRDANKPIVENGKPTFAIATVVVDGVEQQIDEKNVHLFITPGSVLIKGRYLIDSASQSETWITLDIPMIEAVIRPGTGAEGFDDEEVEDTHVDQSIEDSWSQPAAAATAVVPVDTKAVNDLLSQI